MDQTEMMLTICQQQNHVLRALLQRGVFIVDEILALRRTQAELAETWTRDVAAMPPPPSVMTIPDDEYEPSGWFETPGGVLVRFDDEQPVEIQDTGLSMSQVVDAMLAVGWAIELGPFGADGMTSVTKALHIKPDGTIARDERHEPSLATSFALEGAVYRLSIEDDVQHVALSLLSGDGWVHVTSGTWDGRDVHLDRASETMLRVCRDALIRVLRRSVALDEPDEPGHK